MSLHQRLLDDVVVAALAGDAGGEPAHRSAVAIDDRLEGRRMARPRERDQPSVAVETQQRQSGVTGR